MSTSEEVAAKWHTKILRHATIQAITDKTYLYDIADDKSASEVKQYTYSGEINFLQCLVGRAQAFGLTGAVNYAFEVQVTYFRESNRGGSNWAIVRDFFDTLFPLVNSELGKYWEGTVDLWRPQPGFALLNQIELDNRQVWRGQFSYFAEQKSTL